MTVREIDLAPGRLTGWLSRFTADHDAAWAVVDGVLTLTGTDGVTARLRGWAPLPPVTAEADIVAELTRSPEHLALVLLRRGGYAVARARGAELLAHKSGTRYVQGRTAAGGWSQQRFARRRANQADTLVEAAADHAERILRPLLERPGGAGLVLGGDRALLARLLRARPAFAPLAALPTREFADVTNPRHDVLTRTLTRARAVAARIEHP